MRRLYIDCEMGVSGGSLANALMSLGKKQEECYQRLLEAGYPSELLYVKHNEDCFGYQADELMFMDSSDSDDPTSFAKGMSFISNLTFPKAVGASMQKFFDLAESSDIQKLWTLPRIKSFIAETACICMALAELNPGMILVSAVDAGCGVLETEQGNMPVPSAAILNLLDGMELAEAHHGEKCTLDGALILKGLEPFTERRPRMRSPQLGVGDDCNRGLFTMVYLYEAEDQSSIAELACNLDDMTAEEVAFAKEIFCKAGALDVYTTRIGMKKDREGIMLTVMCRMAQRMEMIELIFKHTTTLGIREYESTRYRLSTSKREVNLPEGIVHLKYAAGYGVHRSKAEFEDLKEIALKKNCSIREVRDMAHKLGKGEKDHD